MLAGGGSLLLLAVSVIGVAGQSPQLEQASKTDICRVASEKTEQLIVNHSLREAQQILVEVGQRCPNVPEMFNSLGLAYDSESRYDEARAAFEQATRLEPKNASFHNNLAASFFRSGKQGSGIAEFEKALELDARNSTARLNLAGIYLEKKQYRRALSYLDTAEIRQSQDPVLLLALTEAYYGAAQTQPARETALRLAHLPGLESKVHFSLGLVLAEHGEYQLAAGQFEAIPAGERDVATEMNLGMAYTRLKNFEAARAAYENAIRMDPRDPEPYYHVGIAESALGKHDAAVDWMTQAHNLASSRPDISLALVEELIHTRNYEQARTVLTVATAAHPNDPSLREALGDLFAAQGQRNDAVKTYQECLQLNQRSVSARLSLARVYEEMGQTENARAALAEVLKLSSRNANAEAQLGRLAFEAGHEEEASSLIKRALAHDPNDLLANEYHARLQLRDGQLSEARQTLERLVQLDPQSSRLHLLLGRVLARLNRPAEAEKEFELSKNLERKDGVPEKR
ncbi:MAG: tetratricopeptide repeat protein [Candidatus Acidiferrum sp.]